MMGTTNRQQDAFAFIERYIVANGISPSFDDIATAIGSKSKGHVHTLLTGLKARGLIDWRHNKKRSITITADCQQFTLPSDLDTKLRRYCMAHGEVASAVVADAVALHLDQMEAQHNAPGECKYCGDVS